jgi:sortase A
MTATETGTEVLAAAAATAPQAPETPPPAASSAAAPPPRSQLGGLGIAALAMSLIGLLLIGFIAYLYGLSGLAEAHAQSTLYKTLAGQLGAATAPVGDAPEGSAVAIVGIPDLGISGLVIVEGTTSADLTHGPGLLPGSAFPGQPGISVVYGRASTFGGPFSHLMQLNRGDRITVVTGEGTSSYAVVSFGDSAHPAKNPAANQLVLYTADSPVLGTGYEQVTADLVSQPMASSGALGTASAREAPMAGDAGVAIPLILWAEALIVVVLGALFLTRRWSAPMVLLYATPVALAVTWAVYENLAVLLPNLY